MPVPDMKRVMCPTCTRTWITNDFSVLGCLFTPLECGAYNRLDTVIPDDYKGSLGPMHGIYEAVPAQQFRSKVNVLQKKSA